jgi:hypothetical protein
MLEGERAVSKKGEASGIIIPTVHGTYFCALSVIEQNISGYDEWTVLQKAF